MKRYLGSIEAIGGLLIIAGHLRSVFQPGGESLFLLVPAMAFGLLTVVAGVLLQGGDPQGVPLSVAVQAAQVLSVGTGWRYVAIVGPRVTWVVASTGTQVELGGGGVFTVLPNPPDGTLAGIGFQLNASFGLMASPLASASWTVGINFVALAMLVYLLRIADPRELATLEANVDRNSAPPAF